MRRRAVLSGAALAVAAATGGGWWWMRNDPAPPSVTGVPTGSAKVTRTDLSTTTTVSGTLGYTGTYAVYWQGSGGAATVTWLPQPGQVIGRGGTVFAVGNQAVRLFYGARPAWRSLALGVSAGPDVRALESNLVALGHASTASLTVDGHFTSATAAALRRWQRATHQSVTGELALGAVTFQPGRLRVTTLSVRVGGPAPGGGPLLTATSTTAAVSLAVPVTETHVVHLHDSVTVTLPNGDVVPGRVTELSTVATTPSQDDPGRGGDQLPSVPATITLARQGAGSALDQAPVEVNVVSAAVRNALAVPITALVALADGGYGVYRLDGGTRQLVGVTPGLFSDTLVEIKGDSLPEGAIVEVPAT